MASTATVAAPYTEAPVIAQAATSTGPTKAAPIRGAAVSIVGTAKATVVVAAADVRATSWNRGTDGLAHETCVKLQKSECASVEGILAVHSLMLGHGHLARPFGACDGNPG